MEELLNILRSAGVFDWADDPAVISLRTAFGRKGFSLTPEGFADWEPKQAPEPTAQTKVSFVEPESHEELPSGRVSIQGPTEVYVPGLKLLQDILRRIPFALRPLQVRRRDRTPFTVEDEYDLQDVVEAMLRALYADVRCEERTPSYAGSSSVMDFLVKDEMAAVEIKVSREGRSEKQIKQEILVDIADYAEHPSVATLIVVTYDLAATFGNPQGFERDLTRHHNDLDVNVIVVGWPLPATFPAG